MILDNYKNIIFDCDGVILNSNSIKTEAFVQLAKPFGEANTLNLINYHRKNGGISRYKKFDYFVKNILGNKMEKKNDKEIQELIKRLCDRYSEIVFDSLVNAELAFGLKFLRQKLKYSDWLIVSGGDQDELRKVFEKKSIANYFNKGIYGSPESKYEIFKKCLFNKLIDKRSLFIGDSKLDYEVANHFGIDFVFVSEWTEFEKLNEFAKSKGIKVFKKLINILEFN